jgi:hypothetical protein
LFFGTPGNGQVKKELPKEKVSEPKIISEGQPKLTKTQGSEKSDNVNSSLQDKAGNLWFGTNKRRRQVAWRKTKKAICVLL